MSYIPSICQTNLEKKLFYFKQVFDQINFVYYFCL